MACCCKSGKKITAVKIPAATRLEKIQVGGRRKDRLAAKRS